MQLILLQNVLNLGKLGDKVTVKPGYGRNFLVPHGKAVPATEANLAEFEAKRAEYEAKAKASLDDAESRKAKLEGAEVTIHANAKTGAHHHGHLESVIYVVRGRARMRWGEHLEFTAEAGPGDFIYVPPYVPHQEINASATEVLECVLVRSDGEAVAVNLDIEPVEKPDSVLWIDPVHRG